MQNEKPATANRQTGFPKAGKLASGASRQAGKRQKFAKQETGGQVSQWTGGDLANLQNGKPLIGCEVVTCSRFFSSGNDFIAFSVQSLISSHRGSVLGNAHFTQRENIDFAIAYWSAMVLARAILRACPAPAWGVSLFCN